MEAEKKISKLWEMWENCEGFMQKKDLFNLVDKCINFYEGNHWGKIGNGTKELPRVTINQIEMITNSKVSGILQSKIKTTFYSDKNPGKAEEFTRFNSFIEKEMKFDEICHNIVEDGAVVGGCPVYFYWDEDAVGKHGEYKGGLRAEELDIRNLGVHNPLELDIQKQKWIIIKSRVDVNEVKKMLDDPKCEMLIEPDENDRNLADEQEGTKFCTVLTRFFRNNGEVYFEKATKTAIIHGARPLNPELVDLEEDEKPDSPIDSFSDKPKKETKKQSKFMANLYPIALYTYKKKKDSIYGRGEVEPIIVNNKAINFSFAMIAKSIEDIGFGQVVAKKGALDPGERISNDPTKILIDKYAGAGQGIYSLNKAPFPAQVPTAISAIMDSTRSVTGATEVMTGETIGSNQSGTSIAYLQQQAQRPLNKLTERYKRFRERCAEIMAQFYILFYRNKEFTYKLDDVKINPIQSNNGEQVDPNLIVSIFNGNEYADIDFDITCEAGAGSEWSELTELNMLELALTQGKIDFKTFLKAYPPNLITNKEALLNGIQETENGVLAQAQATIQALQQQLAQCQAYIKQSNQMVNNTSNLIKKNRELEGYLSDLQNEYSNKINTLNNVNQEVTNDASEFAQQIFNSQMQGANNGKQMSNMQ